MMIVAFVARCPVTPLLVCFARLLELALDVVRRAVDEPKRDRRLALPDLVGQDASADVVRALCMALCAPPKRLEHRLEKLFLNEGRGRLGLLREHPREGAELLQKEGKVERLRVLLVAPVARE